MLENLRTKFTKKNRSEIHARKVTYKISLIFPVRIMTKNLSTKNLPNFYYQNFYANKKPKEKNLILCTENRVNYVEQSVEQEAESLRKKRLSS